MNIIFIYFYFTQSAKSKIFGDISHNWTIEIDSPDKFYHKKKYFLRFASISSQAHLAKIFESANDINYLYAFKIVYYSIENITFSDQNDKTNLNFSKKIGNYISLTGKFGTYIYHFFFKPKDSIRLTLFDKQHRIITANIWRNKEISSPPFYIQYFFIISITSILLLTYAIQIWNQYRMMIAQRRLAIKKRALFKSMQMDLIHNDMFL